MYFIFSRPFHYGANFKVGMSNWGAFFLDQLISWNNLNALAIVTLGQYHLRIVEIVYLDVLLRNELNLDAKKDQICRRKNYVYI